MSSTRKTRVPTNGPGKRSSHCRIASTTESAKLGPAHYADVALTENVLKASQLPANKLGFLRQMADRGPFVPLHHARVRLALLEDDGEERGLARAVGPDEPADVAARQADRHVRQRKAGVVLRHAAQLEDRIHGTSTPTRRA